ncbi:hypothetical protein QTP86_014954 [Hemibagrus guttatus]|nr:hypothetical protein QTP86_014954 [Hemibagrus guttatus]
MTEGLVTVLGPSPSLFDLDQPSYDTLKRLYCKNGGHFLRVLPGGAVEGIRQENDAYTLLGNLMICVVKGVYRALLYMNELLEYIYNAIMSTRSSMLKVKAVSAGVVIIRGQEAGHYLAMDRSGKLYGTSLLNDECYFTEKMEENHYNTYSSHKHQEHGVWYVGIKKNGQMKRGPKTHRGQNAVYFLPIPAQRS